MKLSLIAAMSENRVIGRNNALPWDLPTERTLFKTITLGHPVIMGRKTYESLGRALPGRMNIVITRQQEFTAAGCVVVNSLQAALAECEGADEAFICGGEAVFREAMPVADTIYLTIIHEEFEGDTFFPDIPSGFCEAGRKTYCDDTLPYEMVRYEREGSP